MADSTNEILQQIKEPVTEQVGAELKKKYDKLKVLLEFGENPVTLADNPSDDEFRKMAAHAIEKRELVMKMAGEDKSAVIPFEEINRRIHSLDQKTKKELGISNFNIDNLIPSETTLTKVADSVYEAETEAKNSQVSIIIGAAIKLALSLISSIFGKGERISWGEALAQKSSEYVKNEATKKLDGLANDDYAAKSFLQQKTGIDQTAKDSIINAIPQAAYKHFGVVVPDNLKIPESKNIIKDAVTEPAPKIDIDVTINKIRNQVLYPEDKQALETQIAKKILEKSDDKVIAAQAAYDFLPLTSPVEKAKARAELEITKELAINKEDANKMGEKLADLVANSFENAVKDPKFSTLRTKDDMADFIATKISEEFKNHEHLAIIKTVRDEVLQKGLNFAEFASEKSEFMKNKIALEKMPPKIAKNQYEVMTANDAKADIIAGVRAKINDEIFHQLKTASHFVVKARTEQTTAQESTTNDKNSNINANILEQAKANCTTHLGAVKDCHDVEIPANQKTSKLAMSSSTQTTR